MAISGTLIAAGVTIAKQLLNYWQERKKKRPPERPLVEVSEDKREALKSSVANAFKDVIANVETRPTDKELKAVAESIATTVTKPSALFHDRLLEMHSYLNRCLGKIDIYYTLLSTSKGTIRDTLLLQAGRFVGGINQDMTAFLAALKRVDETAINEVTNNFCGAFDERERRFDKENSDLERLAEAGLDISPGALDEWLCAYRDYADCCLVGLEKTLLGK